MGKFCCVPGCNNRANRDKFDGKGQTIGYFQFPPENDPRRAIWIRNIRRDPGPYFSISGTTCVCSMHFEEEYIERLAISTGFRLRLTKVWRWLMDCLIGCCVCSPLLRCLDWLIDWLIEWLNGWWVNLDMHFSTVNIVPPLNLYFFYCGLIWTHRLLTWEVVLLIIWLILRLNRLVCLVVDPLAYSNDWSVDWLIDWLHSLLMFHLIANIARNCSFQGNV